MPEELARSPVAWPLDAEELEHLRWYLEDYLLAPFGVWEERGPAIREKLARWGDLVFESVFGGGPARDAYQRAQGRELEVVFRSADPGPLGLPWELMRDGSGPVALDKGGISRSLPVARGAGILEIPDGPLRVLMVICRPAGTEDVGYQMVARPLVERMAAVRGDVELSVLRPPTFDAFAHAVKQAAENGRPFHVVHFDGHGVMPGRILGAGAVGGRPAMMTGLGEGRLAFERPGGGGELVGASKVARALARGGKIPVVVLNACQSGAVGKELEASVATALLKAGCAAIVAMAYSVYAVAAAEFMASFYESLFAGDSVGQAVTAGRQWLYSHDCRPSPKGDMPLADWLVPVHYMRTEVRFPGICGGRRPAKPSLKEALERIRTTLPEGAACQDPLAPVGAFVGRDDLFYLLETATRLQRVVIVAGPGGTGKTELAKGFARWWRDTGGVDDPLLVLWHSFEPGVATFGLDGVMTEIGLGVFGTDFARLDPSHRLNAVKQLLTQCRALLVWDNFESVREMRDPSEATRLDEVGCGQLREFLQWVRDHSVSTVIITSRSQEEWLGNVRRIEVGGLTQAEAAQYANQLLAPFPAAQRRRERRSFGELLQCLGGHPLAMRLTLPRLDTTDPSDLLAGLQGTSSVVDGAAEEHRLLTLGACIRYSFAHLSEQARRLLPAVSLFNGFADGELLKAFSSVEGVPGRFADISGEQWSEVLEDTARVGLLTGLGWPIYQVHPALPGYLAAEWRAANPGEYETERAGCEQALRTASADFGRWAFRQIRSGNAALAFALIGAQRRTLIAMLGHALDNRAWDDADSIFRALNAYWDLGGLRVEAAAWADRILDAVTGSGQAPPGASSLWIYASSRQAREQIPGQSNEAERAYLRILAYLQDQPETDGNRANISVICNQLSVTAYEQGRLDEADDWCSKSLVIAEELGNRSVMARSYFLLGATAQSRGRIDEADDWCLKSLAIFKELGDRPGMADVYHQLGMTAHHGGRWDKAEGWYRQSLIINEELGNRPGMASTYHQLGMIAHDLGLLDQAEGWYRQSLIIIEELGDRAHMAIAYHSLGITAQHRGRLDEAKDWFGKSFDINERLGNRLGIARTYHQLGRMAQDLGQLDEAEEFYLKTLKITEELGNPSDIARTYGQLGLLAEARQQPCKALGWIIKCVTLFEPFPHPAAGPGSLHLARLSRNLGMPLFEETWQQVTGQPVPQPVRDFIASFRDVVQLGGQP